MDGCLETGSDKLNEFLAGGYEQSVITTIFGPSGAGKTTACLLSVIAAAKNGKILFIDTEGGFSTERLKQLSPDYKAVLDKIVFFKPTNFAEQRRCIDSLQDKLPKGIGLIVCDTISSLYRLERGDNNQAVNAELGRQMGKLLEIARKNSIPIILTNQVYADFDDSTKVRMVGGDIITYNSKCLIELSVLHKNKRKATLKKHRSLPEQEIEFEIRQEGIV
ncbi:DNA repair and recombination protein RadB [Candidatus Woesearchaeota archaeon]|nr:DNA repair and recombination protein RadB [Candidatus Woesearchaeota archaeon]